MRGVAGVLPHNIRPLTWVAAVSVAAVCVGGALYIANAIVSPGKQAAPRLAKVAPGPSQSIAPKAGSVHRKAALSRIEEPAAWETTVAPDVRDPVAEPPVAPDVEDPAALEPEGPEAASGAPTETGRAS